MNDPRRTSVAATMVRWAAAGTMGIAMALVLYRVEPEQSAWLPKCPLHWLTGWHCPGCGSTRAAHALLHGDVGRAMANNPLAVGGVPIVLAFGLWSRRQFGPQWTTAISFRWILLLVAVLVVFTVLRNVPVYPLNLLAPH